MSWPRWFATVVLATLGSLIVAVGAGDFDAKQRAAQQQAAIDQARATSGVEPAGSHP